MNRLTTAQYNHVLEMRLAGCTLQKIQAYMADCILPNDKTPSSAVERKRVERKKKESMED